MKDFGGSIMGEQSSIFDHTTIGQTQVDVVDFHR